MRKSAVDLKSLFQVFKKNVVLLLLVSILMGMAGVFYAQLAITPLYTSSIEVMVDNRSSGDVNPTNGEVISSQELTSTYIVFMKNDLVLKKATEDVNKKYPKGEKYSVGQVRSMLSFSQINDAMFIKITANTPSANRSKDLCIAVAKQAKKAIEETMGVDTIKIVGTANTPTSPSSPNVPLYGAAGLAVGFIGCYAILYILALRDNTIKDKHSLKEYFDLPFFGEIPSFNTTKGSKGYGKYGKYYTKYY